MHDTSYTQKDDDAYHKGASHCRQHVIDQHVADGLVKEGFVQLQTQYPALIGHICIIQNFFKPFGIHKFEAALFVFKNFRHPGRSCFFLPDALQVGVLYNHAFRIDNKGQAHITKINLVCGGVGQLVVVCPPVNDAYDLALVLHGHADNGGHFFGGHADQPHGADHALHAVDKIAAL